MAEALRAREREREGSGLDSSCLISNQAVTSHSSGYATVRVYSPEKGLNHQKKITKKSKL